MLIICTLLLITSLILLLSSLHSIKSLHSKLDTLISLNPTPELESSKLQTERVLYNRTKHPDM